MTILYGVASLSRMVLAGIFAMVAMAVCGHLMIVLANPMLGIALLLGIFQSWYVSLLLAAPAALCVLLVGIWLRRAALRSLALLLVGATSGAVTAIALSSLLAGPSTPHIALSWLIVMGAIPGILGGGVFAYLTPTENLDPNTGS